jgi:transposase
LAYKLEVVAATRAPSATVSAVARRYGLNANMVFSWRRDPRLRENAADAAPAGTTFVPMVVDDASPAGPPAGNDAAGVGRVVIDLPSGARVAIEDTQDVGALVTLLRGLAR